MLTPPELPLGQLEQASAPSEEEDKAAQPASWKVLESVSTDLSYPQTRGVLSTGTCHQLSSHHLLLPLCVLRGDEAPVPQSAVPFPCWRLVECGSGGGVRCHLRLQQDVRSCRFREQTLKWMWGARYLLGVNICGREEELDRKRS